MDERPTKRRGPITWLAGRSRRFWIGLAMLLPVLYVVSFGPACWWTVNHRVPRWMVIYWPLGAMMERHHFGSSALDWWVFYGVDPGGMVHVHTDMHGGGSWLEN